MPPAKLSIHPVGLQEVLSYSDSASLALPVVSPAARYAAEQRPRGLRVPGLGITQESVPDIFTDITRVVRVSSDEALIAACW